MQPILSYTKLSAATTSTFNPFSVELLLMCFIVVATLTDDDDEELVDVVAYPAQVSAVSMPFIILLFAQQFSFSEAVRSQILFLPPLSRFTVFIV